MRLQKGLAALVTGAGSGIGKAISLHLGKLGVNVSVVDISDDGGSETVRLFNEGSAAAAGGAGEEGDGPHSGETSPKAVFIKCDVSKPEQLAHAFSEHMRLFGRLDLCVNNAGIGDNDWFLEDNSTDGTGMWRKLMEVNLMAVIDGTRLAIQAMESNNGDKERGVVINVASSAGLYPFPGWPIYGASKGGVVMFTRTLADLAEGKGVRVNAICPEGIDTALLKIYMERNPEISKMFLKVVGGFIPMEMIVEGVIELMEDESRAGECLWITNRLGKQWWPSEEEKKRYAIEMPPMDVPDS
eukprot:TRINITY_DN1462_c0_g1_i1.p1 TRINITY_DN1462_c0_g1~~TRINITY_DN1462_c0_g1_i1.p1  ORF type:complete len:299 (-),score=53.92 TRINITY_DN1462_c0_g1_i1:327-1223(-)